MTEPLVIIGGGLASGGAVRAIRDGGHDGDIVVISTEPHHPYERPPLSRDYLRREATRSSVFTLAPGWYAENHVDVRTASTVVALDVHSHRLTVADGQDLKYSKLLLATGSSPRSAGLPGEDLLGVLSLRTLENSDLLHATLQEAVRDGGGRLVVIGDGWIGLEVAASARTMGLEVTVLGHGSQPLGKVLGETMGAFYADVHTAHGVIFRRQVVVASIDGIDGRVHGVTLGDGSVIAADVVLVAVGAAPNTGLAVSAGIAVRARELGGGIAVNGCLTTSAPDVYAAGDVASIPSIVYDRPLRVEHWDTALRSGPHAGAAMIGSDTLYDHLPYFYSDQYDVGMEYTGFTAGPGDYDDVVISGSLQSREFVAFWTSQGRVRAGMAVNSWDRIPEIDALIRSRTRAAPDELERFHERPARPQNWSTPTAGGTGSGEACTGSSPSQKSTK
ncbi:NAD(P)/FAD-dependent oxidoreductase [Herbiconiux sp. CPCC 205716]|uniref:NAD(P)/FAD-dependent oxidoreductase n=1 Tax=Herbiconiux gentiana TaxID=2970912 RepID=A0ABT2GAH8_9MICO|nr:FAD/NAD(P)-binding oxidoreductase [Herbiconiux gentiana]MCS5713201.1 NAD(P)/FAD-dependent oxidoreductase [Herbiconiux gentiana]